MSALTLCVRKNVFFFFKQKTAYEISACLVGSEMCIRDRLKMVLIPTTFSAFNLFILGFIILALVGIYWLDKFVISICALPTKVTRSFIHVVLNSLSFVLLAYNFSQILIITLSFTVVKNTSEELGETTVIFVVWLFLLAGFMTGIAFLIIRFRFGKSNESSSAKSLPYSDQRNNFPTDYEKEFRRYCRLDV
eukprot:TRINITY_DN25885_c0_g1_i1.p1 TRINITY_DN25885_c0_g1~~TRINITY_DN25885_c0_g1_i1.p1  ORF type:complete len:192 (+),score=38.72 TRINITY_DN25885_c0_g1_i1:4-579(+)